MAPHSRSLRLGGALAVTSPVRAEPPRFSIVAPGIAHAIFEVRPADAEPFSGHAFKIDLDVAELRLVPAGDPSARRTVEQIVAPYPIVVAVNASFFDKEGRAMGLAVDEGRVMASSKQRNWGALVIDGKKARIMLGADIQDHLAHRLIVQGIPRLLVGGKVQQLKHQVAERTAVCAEGNVVVLVVSTKAEATAFARFLADHNGYLSVKKVSNTLPFSPIKHRDVQAGILFTLLKISIANDDCTNGSVLDFRIGFCNSHTVHV